MRKRERRPPPSKRRMYLPAEYAAAKGTPREEELAESVETHDELRPSGPTNVMAVSEDVQPIPHHADGRGFPHFYPQTFYLVRGEMAKKDGVAQQDFLQVLTRDVDSPRHWQRPPPDGRDHIAPPRGAGPLDHRFRARRRAFCSRGSSSTDCGNTTSVVDLVATPSDFGRQAGAADRIPSYSIGLPVS